MLLVVAVMGLGTTLAGDDGSPVAASDLRGLSNFEGLPTTSFAPQMSADAM